MKCNVCGDDIATKSKTKPKLYCSSNCRNYMKYKNALEVSLINMKVTESAKRIIRGDMFRLSNLLNNGTKSIKQGK